MKTTKTPLKKKLRDNVKGSAVNLRRRLVVFLLILLVAVLAGVMFLLSAFGFLRIGADETERLVRSELIHLSSNTSAQFGGAYVQAVRMSEKLSESIAEFTKRESLLPVDIKKNPELLESLLKELSVVLNNNLDVAGCSGVFLTLDATVNPDIPGAEMSKAGLYIRAIEPSMGVMGTEARYLLRGPSSLTRDSKLNLQARWDLEFDINNQLFWETPISAYEANPALPLSRLVYWCSMSPVQGLHERVMVCSVPLLDGDGNLLGVCGIEISQMNFMLRHEPMLSDYYNIVFAFSSLRGGDILLDDALFSGSSAYYGMFPQNGVMNRLNGFDAFSIYGIADDPAFVGMEDEIRLYPDDSPFNDQTFSALLLIPKASFDAAQNESRFIFGSILFALTALCVAFSIFLSKRYLKPITDTLAAADEAGGYEKTNITEIDQLIEKIIALRKKDAPPPGDLFADFLARLGSLTPTEKEIFRHYAVGKKASVIQAEMHISMSTVKTHSGHIYSKLGITSRAELMLYSELIRKCGMEEKIL